MNENYKQDRRTGKFVPTGAPVMAEKPIAVRLPVEVDAAVRAIPSSERSEWLRKAIAAQLEREQQQDLSV